jgi:excisionase family DNA binding protein
MTEPLVYSIEEAWTAMKISRATLYRMIAAGQIKPRKALGRTLIPKESVDAWLRGEAA